jgi:CDP-diacylglycerol--serine O-phosphatidyltransferase
MDPLLPRLEDAERRRRRRLLFRHNKIPVRMLVPNFFTLLSLCAGLTAIRMAIELRYELAIALVVIAALLDGVDGRLARALKAQSRFGAELDSLADFVNFGVAPAVILFIWGLGGLPRGFGWIVALVFALATGLRLARFNTMLEVEKPKWQSEYFTGMPAPAGAIAVLLPLYVDGLGLFDVRSWPWLIALYTAGMAAVLVSTIPTFSGKLMGERIAREFVLPIFVGVAALVAAHHRRRGVLVTASRDPSRDADAQEGLLSVTAAAQRTAVDEGAAGAGVHHHGAVDADVPGCAVPAAVVSDLREHQQLVRRTADRDAARADHHLPDLQSAVLDLDAGRVLREHSARTGRGGAGGRLRPDGRAVASGPAGCPAGCDRGRDLFVHDRLG